MAILSGHNLSQIFGGFTVFTGVSFRIPHEGKIGLVGPNGIGKTSLLLILAGLAEATTGTLQRAHQLRLGYLRQEAMQAFHDATHTVIEEMHTVFEALQAIEARLRLLEAQLTDHPDALEEYGSLLEEFERRGGYDFEVRIKQTLGGLGIEESHYHTPLLNLSGGQKTRVLLARLLLERPDLLILDEPTNHLDVNAIQWLETTLKTWQGSLLIVSHDRYFLDRVATTIWEMSRTGIESYRGNYSAYVKQRDERAEYHQKRYEQEIERLNAELDYIKRNIARASTNGGAVGRLRRLSRDLAAIAQLGLMEYLNTPNWSETGVGAVRPFTVMEAENAIKTIPAPMRHQPKLQLKLNLNRRSSEIVFKTRDLEVGFPDRPLFTSEDLHLERGEFAALIGGNGTGKTTLLKILMDELAPLAGMIYPGAHLKIGYFAQAHDQLDLNQRVIDEFMRHKPSTLSEARHYLAQYLFRGDDVFKTVGSLSGGERAKLALAILAREGANFLLLDEPTNHLDIAAQEVLQQVLEQFDGTVVMVSHDRYLIDQLATQIWHVDQQHLQVFMGTYSAYLAQGQAPRTDKRAFNVPRPSRPRPPAEIAKLEAQIHSVESSLRELGQLIERAKKSADLALLGQQYAENEARLADLMAQWAELSAEAEQIES